MDHAVAKDELDLGEPETWFAWADERWDDDPLAAHLLMEIGRQRQTDTERALAGEGE